MPPKTISNNTNTQAIDRFVRGNDLDTYPPPDQEHRLRQFLDKMFEMTGIEHSIAARERLKSDVLQRSKWLYDHADLKLPSLVERREMLDATVTSLENVQKTARIAAQKLKSIWMEAPDAAHTLFVHLQEDGIPANEEDLSAQAFENDVAHYESLCATLDVALVRMTTMRRRVEASGYYGYRAAAAVNARVFSQQKGRLVGRPHQEWHGRAVGDVCDWLVEHQRPDLIQPKGRKFRELVRSYVATAAALQIGNDSIEKHAKMVRWALNPGRSEYPLEGGNPKKRRPPPPAD